MGVGFLLKTSWSKSNIGGLPTEYIIWKVDGLYIKCGEYSLLERLYSFSLKDLGFYIKCGVIFVKFKRQRT